ncbi:N-acetylmuramoyl-L-alanine amidase [Hyphobacterium sp. CCMP332]|nr:N-acetylmuramoyl-L-alanine amidase [Hyphobacterium sp. CCMP332]
MKRKYSILVFILSLTQFVNAQSDFIDKIEINLIPGKVQHLNLSEEHSSLAFKSARKLEELSVKLDNEIVELKPDMHVENESVYTSYLIFLNPGSKSLSISSQFRTNLQLFLLKVPKINVNQSLSKLQTDSCEKPAGIDQDVWRSGLPAPTVSPTLNQVNHCVIHHSAGSNTATDYTEVVRNIYLYHTGVNGWDDIGYNYLIAQDGTLFHGRDGQNLYSDDNVRGAHFCGKNTGTMGVCLLGDYTTVVPTLAALSTLEDLLLWKLNKESLQPADSARHPLPGGAYLGRVVGHQDGCATACPGTFLYADIPGIIDSLENRIDNCLTPSSIHFTNTSYELAIYPQPASDIIFIRSEENGMLYIFDLMGREILRIKKTKNPLKINTNAYPHGTYTLKLLNKDRQLKGKIVIQP